jgi:LysM repeat protein
LAQPTAFPTPTPGPDGTIIYIVKEGDTLWRIAAIAGMKPEELAALNGMQVNDFLTLGMQLVLGLGGPAEPTIQAGALPSPTSPPATSTPVYGTGEICVLLYVDQNGNAHKEEEEPALAGGQVSVAEATGGVAGEHQTDGNLEGYCFAELGNGDYNVSAAVPPEYNPTTSMNLPVRLKAGDVQYVQFGAQASAALGGDQDGGDGGRSSVLGLLGVLLLVGAGVLGFAASRAGRGRSKGLR